MGWLRGYVFDLDVQQRTVARIADWVAQYGSVGCPTGRTREILCKREGALT